MQVLSREQLYGLLLYEGDTSVTEIGTSCLQEYSKLFRKQGATEVVYSCESGHRIYDFSVAEHAVVLILVDEQGKQSIRGTRFCNLLAITPKQEYTLQLNDL
jgi:hypothetical protein